MNLRCSSCDFAFRLKTPAESGPNRCPECGIPVNLDQWVNVSERVGSPGRAAIQPGQRIGHFRIDGPSGVGQEHFRATDTRRDRVVTLQFTTENPVDTKLMIREAVVAAALDDPAILPVRELGQDSDRAYVVRDLVEGKSIVRWFHETGADLVDLARLFATVARTLDRAHRDGVFHRRFQPSSVIVDDSGAPQIVDMGFPFDSREQDVPEFGGGSVEKFLAPEIARGKEATAASDTYALAASFQYLATILSKDWPADRTSGGDSGVASIAALRPVLSKAMHRNPAARYASSLAFAEDLERWATGERTRAGDSLPGVLTRASEWLGIHRIAAICAIAILCGIAIDGRLLEFSAGSNQQSIELQILPGNAFVGIIPVNSNSSNPLEEEIIRETTGEDGFLTLKLAPGWYIIESVVPGHGLHEVWRRVPERGQESRSTYMHSNWSIGNDGTVRLHPIEVPEFNLKNDAVEFLGEEPMVLLPGGSIHLKTEQYLNLDKSPVEPKGPRQVPSLLVGQTEVTFARLAKVVDMHSDFIEGPPEETAATHVNFLKALDYCERTGTRLPFYPEYIFAATNGGTTDFPWGNKKPEMDGWQSRSVVGNPDETTLTPAPITGLYSGAMEMTQEMGANVPAMLRPSRADPAVVNELVHRVVGGPAGVIKLGRPFEIEMETISVENYVSRNSIDGSVHVGFRCVRSIRPRFALEPVSIEAATAGNNP